MPWVVGVDGCRAGWLAVSIATPGSTPIASIHEDFGRLADHFAGAACIAVDIPIGLPDRGSRTCDVETRARIKPRSSSVFPAPIRGVLRASSYSDAAAKHRALDNGRSLSKQAFAILPKIAEVDAALRGDPELRKIVHEIHPELSFRTWANLPMQHPKRSPEGEQDRLGLVDGLWPGAVARCALALRKTAGWEDDDLIDAFAALWTAQRIVAGTALIVPGVFEIDSTGLPMRIQA